MMQTVEFRDAKSYEQICPEFDCKWTVNYSFEPNQFWIPGISRNECKLEFYCDSQSLGALILLHYFSKPQSLRDKCELILRSYESKKLIRLEDCILTQISCGSFDTSADDSLYEMNLTFNEALFSTLLS